jgi:hypothetical protein
MITVLSLVAVALLDGCGQAGPKTVTTAPADHGVAQATEASGAQLWADNCSRCHNIRPLQSYSDAQWEAVVMHMRLRADLTGPEQRKITAFLQASN